MQGVNITTVIYTLIIALIFQLYPWAGFGVTLHPDFLFVVVLYWLLRAPHICNIGVAWFAGLLVDLSTGSLLGQYALCYSITAFIALQYQRRIGLFNQFQLMLYVLLLFFIERILVLILKIFAGNAIPDLTYLIPIISNLILWWLLVKSFGRLSRPKTASD